MESREEPSIGSILLRLGLGVGTHLGHLGLAVLGGEYKASCLFLCVLGVDFRVKTLMVDNKTFALQLWDTAGQERYPDCPRQWSGTGAVLRVWEERVAYILGDGDKVYPLKQ